MIAINPQTVIDIIAYNQKLEKETFQVTVLEITPTIMLVKKGTSRLIFNKQKNTMTNKVTGLKCYSKCRFFLRK